MSFFKPVDVFSFFPCQTEDFARLPLAITLTFMAFFIGFFMTFTFFMAFTFMATFFTSTFLQICLFDGWNKFSLKSAFPPNCWERLVLKWTVNPSTSTRKFIHPSFLFFSGTFFTVNFLALGKAFPFISTEPMPRRMVRTFPVFWLVCVIFCKST